MLAACSEPPPPRSVADFVENPILLEATMVRCAQNRSELKYEAECVNAREAVNRLAAAEQQARAAELERQSERKRQALRRTQEAAAQARERAREAQRLREEAEYLGIFEQLPANGGSLQDQGGSTTPPPDSASGNEPGVTISPPEAEPVPEPVLAPEPVPVPDSGPDSGPEPLPEPARTMEPEVGGDLGSIREELKRRQESPE